MKVAVIGRSLSTHHEAPWGESDWERWGLPWDDGYWAQLDRFFEMHDRGELEKPEADRPKDYFERLRDCDWGPLYMQREWDDIPNAMAYPFDIVNHRVFRNFPRWDAEDWYGSSPAYMVALAIAIGAEEIGLWGIDLNAEGEYAYEGPNLHYLLGFAAGQGVKLTLPEGPTELFKYHGENIPFGKTHLTYPQRYGFI